MKNRLTDMPEDQIPHRLGGMGGVTDGPFAAAVREADGLGTIGAFKESRESLAREIRHLQD
jgi:NAD(P)H-dependent flavin oxidoreductase YrpB (nitropropane dioxygenase family)